MIATRATLASLSQRVAEQRRPATAAATAAGAAADRAWLLNLSPLPKPLDSAQEAFDAVDEASSPQAPPCAAADMRPFLGLRLPVTLLHSLRALAIAAGKLRPEASSLVAILAVVRQLSSDGPAYPTDKQAITAHGGGHRRNNGVFSHRTFKEYKAILLPYALSSLLRRFRRRISSRLRVLHAVDQDVSTCGRVGCSLPCHREADGEVHKWCSLSCADAAQRAFATPPCSLLGCAFKCHRDEQGNAHAWCSLAGAKTSREQMANGGTSPPRPGEDGPIAPTLPFHTWPVAASSDSGAIAIGDYASGKVLPPQSPSVSLPSTEGNGSPAHDNDAPDLPDETHYLDARIASSAADRARHRQVALNSRREWAPHLRPNALVWQPYSWQSSSDQNE